MGNKPCEIVEHGRFEHLAQDALNAILTRVVFPDRDIDVFRAVVGWMKANPSESTAFAAILENVVLDSITDTDMATLPSDVHDVVVQLIRILKHKIDASEDGILVDLGHRFKLNSFNMQLAHAEKHTFSYWIDVSEDHVDWTRVIDHSKYPCSSLQNLYFQSRPVRYIRICGTAPVNATFEISKLEALYTTQSLTVLHSSAIDIQANENKVVPIQTSVIAEVPVQKKNCQKRKKMAAFKKNRLKNQKTEAELAVKN
uniref:BACK domain-containing protein n=1 Tax=Panagrellus redivivus TaxID=6233 RepID=A0A7E4W6L1_PANRE